MREEFISMLRLRAVPPAIPSDCIRRPRLMQSLSSGSTGPVTLISAGPGYGKTMALASWTRLRAAPGPVAWLSLEESDNGLQAFWSAVLGALAISQAVPPCGPLLEVVPTAGFDERQVDMIREGLATLPQVLTLVLDDFQVIRDRRVLDSFSHLLDHQPPQLRVVLSGRSDPALHLHRLRVSGGLTDIRAADLAFTVLEAAELFAGNGFRLGDDQVELLHQRTQGWPAGLRLAMMCLDADDPADGIARFDGNEPLVAEYLIEEVTDQLPADEREFLLTTSVADRLCAGLANALTGRDDGQQMLERLQNRNSFVVGLGARATWFAVHPLLRDLLVHRLALERPDAVAPVQVRAARWFAEQGDPIPAIRHASAARNWDEVGRLLTTLALPLVLTARGSALIAALGPAAARAQVAPTANTLLAAAVCHYYRHDFEAMLRAAEDAAASLDDVPVDDRAAAQVVIEVLRVAHSRYRNPASTLGAARDLLGVLRSTPRRGLPAAERYHLIAANNLAVAHLWAGDLVSAELSLVAVEARSHHQGLELVELSAQAHLAMLEALSGRLVEAGRRVRTSRAAADRRGWSAEPQALGLYAAQALIDLEQHRLEDAGAQIDAGLAVSREGSDVACRIVLAIAAVGVAVAQGDVVAARVASARLAAIQVRAGGLPPLLHRWCAVAHADVDLLVGEPRTALDRVGRAPETTGVAAALERVVMAKARLMLDRCAAATDVLAAVTPASTPARGPLVEARVLAAVAADRMRRDTAAMAAITEAVDMAYGAGIVRPFLASGPRVGPLLARHRHLAARHLDFTARIAARIDGCEVRADTPPPSVEELTERELAVLGYLPTMFKSAEIASDLFVTVNTIKSHQQAIYRKLGVTSRRGAVDRARELNLI